MLKVLKKLQTKITLGLILFLLFSPIISYAADLLVSPSSRSANVGEIVTLTINVSSPNENINAVSGTIDFLASNLEVTSISKGGSLIDFWVQEPSFSNSTGTVTFEGIILNGGYQGYNGNILTLNFRTKSAGVSSVKLVAGSVLANDGSGTNVIRSLGRSEIKIDIAPVAPKIEEPVKEVQTEQELDEPIVEEEQVEVIEEGAQTLVPVIDIKPTEEVQVVFCDNVFCGTGLEKTWNGFVDLLVGSQQFLVLLISVIALIFLVLFIIKYLSNKFYGYHRKIYLGVKESQEEIADVLEEIHRDMDRYVEYLEKLKTPRRAQAEKEEIIYMLNNRLDAIRTCSVAGLDYIDRDLNQRLQKVRRISPNIIADAKPKKKRSAKNKTPRENLS